MSRRLWSTTGALAVLAALCGTSTGVTAQDGGFGPWEAVGRPCEGLQAYVRLTPDLCRYQVVLRNDAVDPRSGLVEFSFDRVCRDTASARHAFVGQFPAGSPQERPDTWAKPGESGAAVVGDSDGRWRAVNGEFVPNHFSRLEITKTVAMTPERFAGITAKSDAIREQGAAAGLYRGWSEGQHCATRVVVDFGYRIQGRRWKQPAAGGDSTFLQSIVFERDALRVSTKGSVLASSGPADEFDVKATLRRTSFRSVDMVSSEAVPYPFGNLWLVRCVTHDSGAFTVRAGSETGVENEGLLYFFGREAAEQAVKAIRDWMDREPAAAVVINEGVGFVRDVASTTVRDAALPTADMDDLRKKLAQNILAVAKGRITDAVDESIADLMARGEYDKPLAETTDEEFVEVMDRAFLYRSIEFVLRQLADRGEALERFFARHLGPLLDRASQDGPGPATRREK